MRRSSLRTSLAWREQARMWRSFSMQIYVTRDSVAAGDDGDAPHTEVFEIPGETTLKNAIEIILSKKYLAQIYGGKATWVVSDSKPIAVVAQQWTSSKIFDQFSRDKPISSRVVAEGEALRLHFSYLAQKDPDEVFEIVNRLRLKP